MNALCRAGNAEIEARIAADDAAGIARFAAGLDRAQARYWKRKAIRLIILRPTRSEARYWDRQPLVCYSPVIFRFRAPGGWVLDWEGYPHELFSTYRELVARVSELKKERRPFAPPQPTP